jgi:DNA-binding FadR family transcriptional regulator
MPVRDAAAANPEGRPTMLGGEPVLSRSTPTGRRPSDVVQRVEDVIVRNRLRPGDPLPTEVDLCEAVGASRSSVREAIRTLCALDLVEVRHGHGTYVGRMSMDPLVESVSFRGRLDGADGSALRHEVVEVREHLDQSSAAAFLALPDAPARAELLERLGVLAQQMRDLAARGAPWAQEHRAFHVLLAEPLSNGLLSELAGAFHDIAAAMAAPSRPATSRAALTHVAIVEAAGAGAAEALRDAVAAHYAPLLGDPAPRKA